MFKVTWFEQGKPESQRVQDGERARNLAKSLSNRPGVTGVVCVRDNVRTLDTPVHESSNRRVSYVPYNRRWDFDREVEYFRD